MEMGRDYLSSMLKSGLAFLRATEDACKWPGIDADRLDAIKEARAWVGETMGVLNCECPLVPRSLWSLPIDGGLYFKAVETEEKRYERCRRAIHMVVCDSEIAASGATVEKMPLANDAGVLHGKERRRQDIIREYPQWTRDNPGWKERELVKRLMKVTGVGERTIKGDLAAMRKLNRCDASKGIEQPPKRPKQLTNRMSAIEPKRSS